MRKGISGCKGVSFHKQSGKWNASITINKERKNLGLFTNLKDAIEIRKKSEIENNYYTGDFSKREITQENLRALLHYDPETGKFTWCVNFGGHIEYGKEAGNIDTDDRVGGKTYIRIKIYQQLISAHRLAIFYVTGFWPKELVDHEDGDGTNNKWNNLKQVTHSENNRNARLQHNNISGVMGVNWNHVNKNWNAKINYEGQQIHLGTFKTKQEAILARKTAEKMLGYHKNHGTIRPL